MTHEDALDAFMRSVDIVACTARATLAERRALIEAGEDLVASARQQAFREMDEEVRAHASMHNPADHNQAVGMIRQSLRKLADKGKCTSCGGAGYYMTPGGVPTGDCVSCNGSGVAS